MNRPRLRHRVLRLLHWAVAILLPAQAWLGWTGERSADAAAGLRLLVLHMQLGLTLLVLVLLRLLLRAAGAGRRTVGPAPAAALHAGLYLLLLALPVSGYVIWVWMAAPTALPAGLALPVLFEPPDTDERGRALAWYVHVYGSWALAGLVGLHVAGAAWRKARAAHRRTAAQSRAGWKSTITGFRFRSPASGRAGPQE
jgi:cytochrome b561